MISIVEGSISMQASKRRGSRVKGQGLSQGGKRLGVIHVRNRDAASLKIFLKIHMVLKFH